ncbi:hypothetical protein [Nocardia suismassiliense]|uniref:hypothetical protein n=1 Tax=Nocardia suismassiliense TaxID=2077092 RepID=UPI000D1F48E0|nr:hypothetical protein [Nocardia suismassiliense]
MTRLLGCDFEQLSDVVVTLAFSSKGGCGGGLLRTVPGQFFLGAGFELSYLLATDLDVAITLALALSHRCPCRDVLLDGCGDGLFTLSSLSPARAHPFTVALQAIVNIGPTTRVA